MPFCTLQEVYDSARANLSDTGVTGGDFATNAVLLPWAQTAVRDLFRVMKNVSHPKIMSERYYVLPANTSVLVPSTASITDMQEPETLDERGSLTSVNVTAASNVATGLSVTATAHGFATGDLITLNAIGGMTGTAGLFGITVTNANTFVANGAVAVGTYVSGGVAVKSTAEFIEMANVNRLMASTRNNALLGIWEWRDSKFWFNPVPTDRQLRIRYSSSATAPTSVSDVIYCDDALDFLGVWSAALYAQSQRAKNIYADLAYRACGETRLPEMAMAGGIIRDLMAAAVRRQQTKPTEERSRPQFRNPRAYYDGIYVG